MAAQLKLDTEVVSSAKRRVDDTITVFSSADRMGEETAAMTGHDGVASAVRDFAGNWDSRRATLKKELQVVSDALKAISDTFAAIELRLARLDIRPEGTDEGGN